MPDYKETTIEGKKWQRSCRVIIENPRKGSPSVTYIEQEIIDVGDDEVIRDIGSISRPFDPAATFPLIDPVTMEPTGKTATMAQAYVLLHSYYLHIASERDVAAQVKES